MSNTTDQEREELGEILKQGMPNPATGLYDVKSTLDRLVARDAQREVEARLGRVLNVKRLRAKSRIAVYKEVIANWDKPSFKEYILDLYDLDLKILEAQLPTPPSGRSDSACAGTPLPKNENE